MDTNSYAVIRTGGKQYCVSAGDKIQVEKLEAEAGAEMQLSDVLLVKNGEALAAGKPLVSGAQVAVQVVRHLRGTKILVFKKRSKKGYKKLQGHRQDLTEILIKSLPAVA